MKKLLKEDTIIAKKIDSILSKDNKKKEERVHSGLFKPSGFGRCYRYQYWQRMNEPASNPIGLEVLRIFKLGHLIHDFIQGTLKEEYQSEVLIKTNNALGYADLVGENEVIDVKSVRSFQFRLMNGVRDKKNKSKIIKYDFPAKKMEHILQLCWYALQLQKPYCRLVYVDKDSLDIIEVSFETKEFESKVVEELNTLNRYWTNKELPPAGPRCYDGKECEYCIYQDKCLLKEKGE